MHERDEHRGAARHERLVAEVLEEQGRVRPEPRPGRERGHEQQRTQIAPMTDLRIAHHYAKKEMLFSEF